MLGGPEEGVHHLLLLSQAWDEAWRAAQELAIGVDVYDLERRIRAGVMRLHAVARTGCGEGCRCAWSKALASRRRSVVAVSPVSTAECAAVPRKTANSFRQRAEGKAAMARFLSTAGSRVDEEQWWVRHVQARRVEVVAARGAAAADVPQRAPSGWERVRVKGVQTPATGAPGEQRGSATCTC